MNKKVFTLMVVIAIIVFLIAGMITFMKWFGKSHNNLGAEVKLPVDGVCGEKAGTCVKGTPITPTVNGNMIEWTCKGKNGGKDSQICFVDGITMQNGITIVYASFISEGCNHPSVSDKSKCLEKYFDDYLDYYYIADNDIGSYCVDITDDKIKKKCIDKTGNKYITWFYTNTKFNDLQQAKYMLYAMNGKLLIEKKSSNCSSNYTIGEFKMIIVFASLYIQDGGLADILTIEGNGWCRRCGGDHVEQNGNKLRRRNNVTDEVCFLRIDGKGEIYIDYFTENYTECANWFLKNYVEKEITTCYKLIK